MPQFIKESKDAKEYSKETFDKVKDCIDAEREEFKEIVHKMNYELAWWNKCSENLDKQKITYLNSKNL
jgi:maltooligosyltrehalose synthase